MNRTARDIDTQNAGDDRATSAVAGRTPRSRLWVNWVLALLTVPAAVIVLIFGLGAVMSTSGCSNPQCHGPNGVVFGVLFYGAPIIAALTIVASFFTARRGWGIVVPLCALVLLAADVGFMAVAFQT